MEENTLIRTGIKNSIFVLSAQLVNLIIGVIRTIILPLSLGVKNYGYYQVFILYIAYAGLFAFGFNDGIYLRYGSYSYNELPKPKLRSSIRLFIIIQLIILIITYTIFSLEPDPNKRFALIWVSINIPIVGLAGVFNYIFQVTNQLKKFSLFVFLERFIFMLLIAGLLLTGNGQFNKIIAADTSSKFFILVVMLISLKEIVFGEGVKFSEAAKELYSNVNAGVKLLLANLAGMLVLGLGRIIVERLEDVEVYSNYSLAISTINIFLLFISAIGLVIYPTFNRLKKELLSKYYSNTNYLLNLSAFGLLLAYFPIRIFILNYMTDYSDIIAYLPVIFSIVFVQTKMQILINPFFKILREEKIMLYTNIAGLLLAILLIIPLYLINQEVIMVAIGTLIAMIIRLFYSEHYLSNILKIRNMKNIFVELSAILIFIFFAFQPNIYVGISGSLITYVIYILSQRKKLIPTIESIREKFLT